MKYENINIDLLISRFVDKTATETEKNNLLSWVESSVENKDYFVQQSTFLYETSTNNITFSSSKAFEKVKGKLESVQSSSSATKSNTIGAKSIASKGLMSKPALLTIATIGATVIVGIVLKLLLFSNSGNNDIINKKYSTTDSTLSITLSDESRITLNKNSSIIAHNSEIEKDTQKVSLQGTAYIEANNKQVLSIASDFIEVNAKDADFEIENNKDSINISVFKGYVKGKNNANGEMLSLGENEAGTFTKETNKKAILKNKNTISWKTNTLEFSNTPLKEAIPEIEKYFNITMRFKNRELEECLLNAKLEKYKFRDVKKMFEIAFGFTISKEDGIYYIEGNPCN